MSLSPRIVTLGSWGVPSTPSFASKLSGIDFESVEIGGGQLANLRQYRKGSKDGVTQSAIGLDFTVVPLETKNTIAAWTPSSATYFSTVPKLFDTAISGVIYSNGAANAAASFVSNYTIPLNGAFTLRMYLHDKHEDQPKQIVALMWERWRLEIIDRSLNIQRTSANWTTAKQLQLDTLLNVDGQLSDANQATYDALKLDIYEPGYDGSVQATEHKTDEGEWFELTFIPEPRGILNIISGKGETTVERADITATRQVGVLWPACPLTVTTNGGAMFWQIGFPAFATRGTLKTAPFKWWYPTNLTSTPPAVAGQGLMTFRGQSDASSPGVGLAFSLASLSDTIEYQVTAALTSDGSYSPFIYSQEGFVAAGVRTGTNTTSWDSDTVADFTANGTPIKTLTPQYEGEMIRRTATIEMRMIKGNLALPGVAQKLLHDKICNVEIGGNPFITRGLVKSVQLGYAAQATANVTEATTCNAWSSLTIEVADQWAIMESDLMLDCPKGDGLNLGAYMRLILKGAGVKDSEMTGISPTFGRVLPNAAPGEDFLIQPSAEASRADWMHGTMTDWGMGSWFYISAAGVWTLSDPNTTVQADFTSSATTGYRILEPLDIVRDFGDFYNWFCVEGAEINGRRLRQTWTVQESISAPNFVGYLGRYRRFPTIRNDALRTKSDVAWVLRSTVRYNARPGRFFNFETNFHAHLVPGHYITVDGVLCRIVRIEGGSIDFGNDRMRICAQEVIFVA